MPDNVRFLHGSGLLKQRRIIDTTSWKNEGLWCDDKLDLYLQGRR
jgi:hypothetical protein